MDGLGIVVIILVMRHFDDQPGIAALACGEADLLAQPGAGGLGLGQGFGERTACRRKCCSRKKMKRPAAMMTAAPMKVGMSLISPKTR